MRPAIKEPLKVTRQRQIVNNAVAGSVALVFLFVLWFRVLHPTTATAEDMPSLQQQQQQPEQEFHFVFSTGCNMFQHWQSEVLLNSHLRSGQRGEITRVVSGCDSSETDREHAKFLTHPEGLADDNVPLELLSKSSHPRFHLHLTPSFPGAKEFPWINKPMGLNHWLQSTSLRPNVVVVILDPDQFFLQKLSLDRTPDEVLCTAGCRGDEDRHPKEQVSSGHPLAQLYGLGGSFVHKFNTKQFAGPDSPAAQLNSRDAAKYYSVGPPMIALKSDFDKIFPKWVEFMQPVFETDPGDIQADMYAYSLAAAHYDLKHQSLDHFMISVPVTSGEAWPFFNRLAAQNKLGRCSSPNEYFGRELSPFLHIAHRYDSELTSFMFHKGHVAPNIFSCDLPILVMPPEDLIQTAPGLKQQQAMYMLCNAYVLINQALVDWKAKFCRGGGNLSQGIKLNKRSQNCRAEDVGKTCWDFALLEQQ